MIVNLDNKVLKQSLKPLCEDVIWVTLEDIASDQSIWTQFSRTLELYH